MGRKQAIVLENGSKLRMNKRTWKISKSFRVRCLMFSLPKNRKYISETKHLRAYVCVQRVYVCEYTYIAVCVCPLFITEEGPSLSPGGRSSRRGQAAASPPPRAALGQINLRTKRSQSSPFFETVNIERE